VSKTISIVLPTWNRTKLLANTLASIARQTRQPSEIIVVEDRPRDSSTRHVCIGYGAKHIPVPGESIEYRNVGFVYNRGIEQATGDIVIMQSAECMYESKTGIADLVSAIESDGYASAVPLVRSLSPTGRFIEWFCHPTLGGRPGWTGMFCHAIHRQRLVEVGGYDEIFKGYGFDDDLLLYRLKKNGVNPRHVNTIVSHQWHERHATIQRETDANKLIYDAKILEIERGG
jgi:glycosyltransferase involved in cell wall biosynthesis